MILIRIKGRIDRRLVPALLESLEKVGNDPRATEETNCFEIQFELNTNRNWYIQCANLDWLYSVLLARGLELPASCIVCGPADGYTEDIDLLEIPKHVSVLRARFPGTPVFSITTQPELDLFEPEQRPVVAG